VADTPTRGFVANAGRLMTIYMVSDGGGAGANNAELREDGSRELREDGTIELRE